MNRSVRVGMRRSAAVLVAGAVWQTSCLAATYYVAPDGTPQGDGSRDKPFSLEHVVNTVKPQAGDEVVFRDGVYRPPLAITSVGTEKAPVVWRAENRHQAILDGGTPLTGWKRTPGEAPIWECQAPALPTGMLVNGDGLINGESEWHRRDGQKALLEGMFVAEKTDAGVVIHVYAWDGKEPKDAYALAGQLMTVHGSFNIVDGFVCRRAEHGIQLGGRQVHVYKLDPGVYFDVCGLANNVFGTFNIVRNCIVRDTPGQGMTSNESRFNLIEDCVIYNAGQGQGEHGIYISQGAENLVLRRNIWWRTAGGAVHIYSGSGTDSPRGIVVEYNIFGPDKRNRCFPLKNRKSTAIYIWGGHRWAGHNRILHNLVIGPHDRAISMHRCSFNTVANNVFLGSDGAPLQIGDSIGNVVANNIVEYSPGVVEGCPAGYMTFLDPALTPLSVYAGNLLLPRDGKGTEIPPYLAGSRVAAAAPFVNRAGFDFRIKPESEAVDLGVALNNVTGKPAGAAPDAGAVEAGEEFFGAQDKFPPIPKWLLDEWPLAKRGQ